MPLTPWRPSRRHLITASAAAVILAAGVPLVHALGERQSSGDAEDDHDPMVGSSAPALAGSDPEGAPTGIDSYLGRPILLNVWASWCAPCRHEMPMLLDAWHRWRDEGLVLLGLNPADRPREALAFLHDLSAGDLPTVSDPDSRIAVRWGVRGVPETFAINRNGIVAARRIGEVTPSWLDATIVSLVRP